MIYATVLGQYLILFVLVSNTVIAEVKIFRRADTYINKTQVLCTYDKYEHYLFGAIKKHKYKVDFGKYKVCQSPNGIRAGRTFGHGDFIGTRYSEVVDEVKKVEYTSMELRSLDKVQEICSLSQKNEILNLSKDYQDFSFFYHNELV